MAWVGGDYLLAAESQFGLQNKPDASTGLNLTGLRQINLSKLFTTFKYRRRIYSQKEIVIMNSFDKSCVALGINPQGDLAESLRYSTGDASGMEFYINPNQFSHIDDEVSDQAGHDEVVDTIIQTEEEARAEALRLAQLVGYHVDVDAVTERHGEREYERAFTVYPWSDKASAALV